MKSETPVSATWRNECFNFQIKRIWKTHPRRKQKYKEAIGSVQWTTDCSFAHKSNAFMNVVPGMAFQNWKQINNLLDILSMKPFSLQIDSLLLPSSSSAASVFFARKIIYFYFLSRLHILYIYQRHLTDNSVSGYCSAFWRVLPFHDPHLSGIFIKYSYLLMWVPAFRVRPPASK